MEFTVRGPPQLVRRIDDADFTLHDPLLVTVLDFDRRALDQLAHGLHLAVTCTYNYARGIDKERFFENRYHNGVDPSQDEGGQDVYYLLKNVEENANKYDKLLEQSEEDVKETANFLRENIRNAMAHQTYLKCPSLPDQTSSASCVLTKSRTTKECLDKCAALLQWIVNASFYQRIRKKVTVLREFTFNLCIEFSVQNQNTSFFSTCNLNVCFSRGKPPILRESDAPLSD
jgi:ATP-dependent exoDNAse (exonuclease V) beta subunit